MTKLTLKNRYGRYQIELDREDLTFDELFEELVRPLMLAAGYTEHTIDEYLGADEEETKKWPSG